MPKVTLDMSTFKALASDTRLQILRVLDGKKMNLQEISRVTKLNKATLHEHLQKLHEAGLVKKHEREGHKWVYYKLSWKGESLLHPENTRVVVMFTATFIALAVGVIEFIQYIKGYAAEKIVEKNIHHVSYPSQSSGENVSLINDSLIRGEHAYNFDFTKNTSNVLHDPILQWVCIACFIMFAVLLTVSIWRYKKNRVCKL